MVIRRRIRLTHDGYKASKGNGDRGDGIEAARLVGKTYLYNGFVFCEDMAPGAHPRALHHSSLPRHAATHAGNIGDNRVRVGSNHGMSKLKVYVAAVGG